MSKSDDVETSALREALALLQPEADAVVGDFYDRLLERRPDFRPHFATTDWTRQRRMLLHALVLAIEMAEEPDEVAKTLRGFGRRHDSLGLSGADYEEFGELLGETLRDHLGAAWTDDVASIWDNTYPNLVRRMLG